MCLFQAIIPRHGAHRENLAVPHNMTAPTRVGARRGRPVAEPSLQARHLDRSVASQLDNAGPKVHLVSHSARFRAEMTASVI